MTKKMPRHGTKMKRKWNQEKPLVRKWRFAPLQRGAKRGVEACASTRLPPTNFSFSVFTSWQSAISIEKSSNMYTRSVPTKFLLPKTKLNRYWVKWNYRFVLGRTRTMLHQWIPANRLDSLKCDDSHNYRTIVARLATRGWDILFKTLK